MVVGTTSRIWQPAPYILLTSLQLNLATAFIALRRLFISRRTLLIWCIVFSIQHFLQSLLIPPSLPISPSVASPGLSSLSSSPIPPHYPPFLLPFRLLYASCLPGHDLIQSSLATAGHPSFHIFQLSLNHALISSSVLPSRLMTSTWTPTMAYCVHLACLCASLYLFFARAKLCMSGLEVEAGSKVVVGSKD